MHTRLILLINGVCETWYHHVRNDVRRTTKQLYLSAIVQARHFSLLRGHIARMPDKTDAKKILTASPFGELGTWGDHRIPRTTWIKTIQQDMKSNNLSLNEAIDVAQYHLLETDVLCLALQVVHAKNKGLYLEVVHPSSGIWIWTIIANLLMDISAMECAHLRAWCSRQMASEGWYRSQRGDGIW